MDCQSEPLLRRQQLVMLIEVGRVFVGPFRDRAFPFLSCLAPR
jgi:hypothetical protein